MIYPKRDLGLSALLMMMGADVKNNIVVNSSVCTVVKGMNTTTIMEKPFEFTWTPNALYLTDD